MDEKLRRNIPILSLFSFFWLSLVIIPVIVPFFESKGLTLSQVYYLQAIFAFVIVVCEVPSGYIADVLGRKNALVAGSLFHGLGFTLLNFADGFIGLVLFEATVGIGVSLLSGADLSLLYDTQQNLQQSPREKASGIANMRFIKSAAEGVAAIVGGFLIAFSFDAVVIANTVVAWFPLLLTFFLVEAPFDKMPLRMANQEPRMRPDQHLRNLKLIVRFMFVDDRLLRLICLNITFFSLATFYVIWMLQPYWRDQNVPLTAFGMLWAAISFLVAIASKASLPLEDRFGPKPVLLMMGILPIVGYLGMAGFGGAIGILLGFSFSVSRGFNQVILSDALNRRVPSAFRATANSITSFMFRGVYIVTGPVVGLLIGHFGMQFTLRVLGVVVLVFLVLFLRPLLGEIRTTVLPAMSAATTEFTKGR